MGNRNISTAIDLSGLGLERNSGDMIDEFVIGCMTSLRERLKQIRDLNEYTQAEPFGRVSVIL